MKLERSNSSRMSIRFRITLAAGFVLGLTCLFLFLYLSTHPANATHRTSLAVMIGAAFLWGMAAIFITTVIATRPLRMLVKIAERAAKGDLRGRMSIISKDEVGLLASAVNTILLNTESAVKRL